MLKKYVICIDEVDYITKGKIYEVLEEKQALYFIIDNKSGYPVGYLKYRFKDIDPKREDWGISNA